MDPDEQLASALVYATQQARYYDPCEIERLARMIGLARATHDPDLQTRTLELLSAWHEHMISVRKGGPGIPPPAAFRVSGHGGGACCASCAVKAPCESGCGAA